MPDWFYRTIARPALFTLPHRLARNLALGFMGRLARLPGGGLVIDFLGHMRPDARLARTVAGIRFPTPIGLGCALDASAVALPALARFGVGFLELGPVTPEGRGDGSGTRRLSDPEGLAVADPPDTLSFAVAAGRVREAAPLGVPLIVRLMCRPGDSPAKATEDLVGLVRELAAAGASVFALATLGEARGANWPDEEWGRHVSAVVGAAGGRPVLLTVPADPAADEDRRLASALSAGVSGFHIDGSVTGASASERILGRAAREPALATLRRLREKFGREPAILAGGGVHEPGDALAFRRAGADLIAADTGMVFTGPGLPKRANDAILHEALLRAAPAPTSDDGHAPGRSWFWLMLMGLGMVFGSVLAVGIAATRVVLPYDEAFVGMSRDQLHAVNPRLLAFMTHDRVSLAGTMIAVGLLYTSLAVFGVRRARHWAQTSVFVSAFSGFATFFLFLGYGYLDTFHAFVSAVLLQLLLLGVHARLGEPEPQPAPMLGSDRAWMSAQWGQLLCVIHAVLLLAAGAVICVVALTDVFVPSDLEFLETTGEALAAANPRLVPLIAHDRATFGGMLLSAGWAFLLPTLWGWRNGSAWLWWTLLAAGTSAYAAAIVVHHSVGYTDMHHLLPAWGGLALLWTGLALSRSYLCAARQEWPPA